MPKSMIAVSGSKGQLGQELQQLQEQFSDAFDFVFLDRESFDLLDDASIGRFFSTHTPRYFINCAAYTAVDKAEADQATAYRANAEAVGIIAQHCARQDCLLVQISTDYVFNGKGNQPYQPGDTTNPVNYYGYTKWLGEKLALQNNPRTVVIRTSWVYSFFGNNFVKTMLRLMQQRSELSVVADQTGSPTYAADLALTVMQIVASAEKGTTHTGIYHFSNTGAITWYEFASAIRDIAGFTTMVHPISTAGYPAPAKRPAYSVMDTSKIVSDYQVVPKDWKQSLKRCLALLLA